MEPSNWSCRAFAPKFARVDVDRFAKPLECPRRTLSWKRSLPPWHLFLDACGKAVVCGSCMCVPTFNWSVGPTRSFWAMPHIMAQQLCPWAGIRGKLVALPQVKHSTRTCHLFETQNEISHKLYVVIEGQRFHTEEYVFLESVQSMNDYRPPNHTPTPHHRGEGGGGGALRFYNIPGDPKVRVFFVKRFCPQKNCHTVFSRFFHHFIAEMRVLYGQIRSMIEKNAATGPNTGIWPQKKNTVRGSRYMLSIVKNAQRRHRRAMWHAFGVSGSCWGRIWVMVHFVPPYCCKGSVVKQGRKLCRKAGPNGRQVLPAEQSWNNQNRRPALRAACSLAPGEAICCQRNWPFTRPSLQRFRFLRKHYALDICVVWHSQPGKNKRKIQIIGVLVPARQPE